MTGASSLGGLCPVCRKPRGHEFRPFCSKRCADIDLGRWLKGSYTIAAGSGGDDDEALHGSDPAAPRADPGSKEHS